MFRCLKPEDMSHDGLQSILHEEVAIMIKTGTQGFLVYMIMRYPHICPNEHKYALLSYSPGITVTINKIYETISCLFTHRLQLSTVLYSKSLDI